MRLLYPTGRVVSLREVLTQVDALTGFSARFVHKSFVQKPTRPDLRLLLAAIIGYGENIGIRKMAAAADRPDLAPHLGPRLRDGGHPVLFARDGLGGQRLYRRSQ